MKISPSLRSGILMSIAMLIFACGCSEPPSSPKPPASASRSGSANTKKNEAPPRSVESAAATNEKPVKSANAPQISADAFREAALNGRLDVVRSAVESGMDVNGIDPAQSMTALHLAAYNGHTETVQYLIERGATVDCRDAEGKTPLIHACTGPFAKSVKALIDAGADVNARDSTESFTPLMMAAGLGEPEVVKVLLEHNADKSLLDDDQESAADHARNSGHTAIVEMLK